MSRCNGSTVDCNGSTVDWQYSGLLTCGERRCVSRCNGSTVDC